MPSEDARLACVSDVGRQRSENQDTSVCDPLHRSKSAGRRPPDGMGGPTGGKQTSETAVSTTLDALQLAGDTAVTTPTDTIKSGKIIPSKTVYSEEIDPDDSPAGTTQKNSVGDCRLDRDR